MSTDYYSRLEQQRGPQPSEPMLSAIARAAPLAGRAGPLFRLAGYSTPRTRRTDHVNPALMRVLDRLDTPAQVMSDLGDTLVQNVLAVALLGDQTRYTGPARSMLYRWFTDPGERDIYPEEDQPRHTRAYVAGARAILARDRDDHRAREIIDQLLEISPEFAQLWSEHEVAVRLSDRKQMTHPRVGTIELHCQQ